MYFHQQYNTQYYFFHQHVSAILENGSAERAGIRKGDRILEVYVLHFSVMLSMHPRIYILFILEMV